MHHERTVSLIVLYLLTTISVLRGWISSLCVPAPRREASGRHKGVMIFSIRLFLGESIQSLLHAWKIIPRMLKRVSASGLDFLNSFKLLRKDTDYTHKKGFCLCIRFMKHA